MDKRRKTAWTHSKTSECFTESSEVVLLSPSFLKDSVMSPLSTLKGPRTQSGHCTGPTWDLHPQATRASRAQPGHASHTITGTCLKGCKDSRPAQGRLSGLDCIFKKTKQDQRPKIKTDHESHEEFKYKPKFKDHPQLCFHCQMFHVDLSCF